MVYFANLCVNLRDCLCDVARHVSAQYLDFLDLDEISSFLDWKRKHVSILKEGPLWMVTRYVQQRGQKAPWSTYCCTRFMKP